MGGEKEEQDQQLGKVDDEQMQSVKPLPEIEDMIACVNTLEAALIPCLNDFELNVKAPVPDFEAPITTEFDQSSATGELQASNDFSWPLHHQTDVEKHAREFMEAAKKLQQYFISMQREDKPTKAQTIKKEIIAMEEELKKKNELIQKQAKVIQEWKKELGERLETHKAELGRV